MRLHNTLHQVTFQLLVNSIKGYLNWANRHFSTVNYKIFDSSQFQSSIITKDLRRYLALHFLFISPKHTYLSCKHESEGKRKEQANQGQHVASFEIFWKMSYCDIRLYSLQDIHLSHTWNLLVQDQTVWHHQMEPPELKERNDYLNLLLLFYLLLDVNMTHLSRNDSFVNTNKPIFECF